MTDTTSMSARDSIAGSASLFAELLDGRQEEAVSPPSDTIDNLTTIVNDEVAEQFAQVMDGPYTNISVNGMGYAAAASNHMMKKTNTGKYYGNPIKSIQNTTRKTCTTTPLTWSMVKLKQTAVMP